MTQGSLFDSNRRPTLPHAGLTRIARECSMAGAKAAAPRRARLRERYLEYLGLIGSATDRQAAEYLGVPLSSICSTRGALRDRVEPVGKAMAEFGVPNTLWALRAR